MPFGISLTFDAQTDQLVRSVWQRLASQKISSSMIDTGYPPHVTLAVWDSPDATFMAPGIEKIVAQAPPVRAVIESAGLFLHDGGAVYLAPTVTSELLELHRAVCGVLAEQNANVREYYKPGWWIPHCTLAIGLPPERLPDAISVSREIALPGSSSFAELGIGRFPPGERLYTFPLASNS